MDFCLRTRVNSGARRSDSGSESTEWRFGAEKHSVDGNLWARMFYVIQDRVSCILWQRQTDIPTSFAMHQQGGVLPIDIARTHAGNVAPSEPKPNQQQNDGAVAQRLRPLLGTRINEVSRLFRVEVTRQR